jgi:hypothetical protein
MILKEIRELKAGPRELRKFGLVVGGVFIALGTLMRVKGRSHHPFFLALGLFLLVGGLVLPRALKWIYVVWMSLAIALGFVVSRVLLTVFFFLGVTPVGLVSRLAGRDFLQLKLDPKAQTYWQRRDRKSPPSDYERQF